MLADEFEELEKEIKEKTEVLEGDSQSQGSVNEQDIESLLNKLQELQSKYNGAISDTTLTALRIKLDKLSDRFSTGQNLIHLPKEFEYYKNALKGVQNKYSDVEKLPRKLSEKRQILQQKKLEVLHAKVTELEAENTSLKASLNESDAEKTSVLNELSKKNAEIKKQLNEYEIKNADNIFTSDELSAALMYSTIEELKAEPDKVRTDISGALSPPVSTNTNLRESYRDSSLQEFIKKKIGNHVEIYRVSMHAEKKGAEAVSSVINKVQEPSLGNLMEDEVKYQVSVQGDLNSSITLEKQNASIKGETGVPASEEKCANLLLVLIKAGQKDISIDTKPGDGAFESLPEKLKQMINSIHDSKDSINQETANQFLRNLNQFIEDNSTMFTVEPKENLKSQMEQTKWTVAGKDVFTPQPGQGLSLRGGPS